MEKLEITRQIINSLLESKIKNFIKNRYSVIYSHLYSLRVQRYLFRSFERNTISVGNINKTNLYLHKGLRIPETFPCICYMCSSFKSQLEGSPAPAAKIIFKYLSVLSLTSIYNCTSTNRHLKLFTLKMCKSSILTVFEIIHTSQNYSLMTLHFRNVQYFNRIITLG